jgi:hypothetical protein
MATTTATIPDRLAETLIVDTTADATAEDDVFSGITLATKIYCIKLDNSAVNAVSYFKGQIAAQYATGTAPGIRLYAPANGIVEYIFPSGWPANLLSGSDKFCFIGTSTAASTGTQSSPSGGDLKVTILAGT